MKTTNIVLTIMTSILPTTYLHSQEFLQLEKKYEEFVKNICPFPTSNNTITAIAQQNPITQKKIIGFAKSSYVILDDKTKDLCNTFLTFKKTYGSDIEQTLYINMTLSDFLMRLLEKRPLVFINENDTCKLRNPHAQPLSMDFTKIGTDEEQSPLTLNDYLSYDEIKIAALVGVSSPTFFINDGNRNNAGKIDSTGNFESNGIYVGLVGARFEKENFMEWQDIIITEEQNTDANGYGLTKCNEDLIKIWSDFYEHKFPTYDEAKNDTTNQYTRIGQNFFNKIVYKKRIERVIKPFLLDANKRGKEQNKKTYIHAVGLGLGVWALLQQEQAKCIIEVYKDIINKNNFPYIADIDFSWFEKNSESLVPTMHNNSVCFDKNKNQIAIHFSQRNPADTLTGIHANKLLVACYAWDGNAYPGNEYWIGMLNATGDPAAACCSLIATLQNILINPWLKTNIVTQYGPTSSIKVIKAPTIQAPVTTSIKQTSRTKRARPMPQTKRTKTRSTRRNRPTKKTTRRTTRR